MPPVRSLDHTIEKKLHIVNNGTIINQLYYKNVFIYHNNIIKQKVVINQFDN